MRHIIITKVGGLFMAVTLALFLGGVTSGCGSGAVILPGQAGVEITMIDDTVLEVVFDFLDGDVLDVDGGLEINFNEPIDPGSFYDENGAPRIAFFNNDGGEMEIIRIAFRNDNRTIFFAVPFRAQAQYVIRIAAGLRSMNGAEFAQPVQRLFITAPNRSSLFGDNLASLAFASPLSSVGHAIAGSLFSGDGSDVLLSAILDQVFNLGDGVTKVVRQLFNLNMGGAAVAVIEDMDTGMREHHYYADLMVDSSTRFALPSLDYSASYARSIRDLNGDGVRDILLCVEYRDRDGKYRNDYIFYARAFGDVESVEDADIKFSVIMVSDALASSDVAVGDVNGDGFNDLLKVVYNNATGRYDLNIYMGGADGLMASASDKAALAAPNVTVTSAGVNDSIVFAYSGDMSGDGIDDIVVTEMTDGLSAGRFVVLLGSEALSAQMTTAKDSAFAYISCENQKSCGTRKPYTTAVTDVNGDEIADLVIGSPVHMGSGAAYIIFGDEGTEGIKDANGLVIDTVLNADRFLFGSNVRTFGGVVEGVGDINGDGEDELVVTARDINSGYWVYYIYSGKDLRLIDAKIIGADDVFNRFVVDPPPKPPRD